MGSFRGRILRVATFGESHGPGLGVVVEGAPAGLELDQSQIQAELDKRRPGTSPHVSSRREPDQVEILSGLAEGKTLGTPIAMLVRNQDVRSQDYNELAKVFRPGHADYAYWRKYSIPPQPGGGRASGRETLARVAAGAVAKVFLKPVGISFAAYTVRVGQVRAQRIDRQFAMGHQLRAADPDLAEAMVEEINKARESGDSVGGVVELLIDNPPPGLGDPVFDKLDALLGGALFSIGGIKGVEIGSGFDAARRRGSENNDQMGPEGFLSNHAGGVLGGISSGQPIVMRLAVKPTPSISREQASQDLQGRPTAISIKGRHDPCLCPRVAPVAEAMAALVIADAWLMQIALERSRQ